MSITTGITLRFAIASFFWEFEDRAGEGAGGTYTGVQRMSWCGRTGSLERQMDSSHESIYRTIRCSWNGLIWAAFDVFSIWHTRRKTKAFRVLKPNENHFTTRSTRSGPELTMWSCSNLMVYPRRGGLVARLVHRLFRVLLRLSVAPSSLSRSRGWWRLIAFRSHRATFPSSPLVRQPDFTETLGVERLWSFVISCPIGL